MQEAIHARQELHEHAELGRAYRASADHLPLAQPSRHRGPRIALEGLQAERDAALLLVDPQDLDGDRVAHAQEIGRPARARVRKLGQGHEPLHAAQVDERAEIRERGHRAGEHRAGEDLLSRLLGHLGGALLEQTPSGEHQVAPVVAEGRDAKLEDAADVFLRGLDAAQIHLREGTEPAQAADRHLVAAFDHGRDLALDRNAGLGRDGEGLPGLRALAELVREPDLVTGRHDRGLDLVADGHAEPAFVVGQLGALDPRLALAAHVDEDALRRDLDDAPLHNLADL